jgi:hypothetical protein
MRFGFWGTRGQGRREEKEGGNRNRKVEKRWKGKGI